MDIKILDSHLREYLDTKASAHDIARYASLCGPTFDRVHSTTSHGPDGKAKKDFIYEIEVTTNRVDAASVLGIAREVAAILPRFGIPAKFKLSKLIKFNDAPKPSGATLKFKSDPKLVNRLTGVVIDNIQNWTTPRWIVDRLEAAGIRSLNSVVDITNYVMISIGHPCHAFDYDKIESGFIEVAESKKGETIEAFDGKKHVLPGGDIVFKDKNGIIIDLPGIIGVKNTVVSKDTKRVLFFFDNLNAFRIRKTSMTLALRTFAATLNEKRVDAELIPTALELGVDLYKKICGAKITSSVEDTHHKPYKDKEVVTTKEFIDKILGINVSKPEIAKTLGSLGMIAKWRANLLTVNVPSFRSDDVSIPEDIVEEIARIYGYHNLPGMIMPGAIPKPLSDSPFDFENKLRLALKNLGAIETLTYSLVSKDMVNAGALKLVNPLGSDTEYLRTNLVNSLFGAVAQNRGEQDPYHIFEIANTYLPVKGDLPREQMTLGGVFVNYDYRHAKGVIEALFDDMGINHDVRIEKRRGIYFYEYTIKDLERTVGAKRYSPPAKYPPQIEDVTISIPQGAGVGNMISNIKSKSELIQSVELTDMYEGNFTFRITYQHPERTLTDQEIARVREKIKV